MITPGKSGPLTDIIHDRPGKWDLILKLAVLPPSTWYKRGPTNQIYMSPEITAFTTGTIPIMSQWPRSNRLSPRAKFLLRHAPPVDPELVAEVQFTCMGMHIISISMGSVRPAEYGQQHVFVS